MGVNPQANKPADPPENVGTLETPEATPNAQPVAKDPPVDGGDDGLRKAFDGFSTKVTEWQTGLDQKLTDLIAKVSPSQSAPAQESPGESAPASKPDPDPQPIVTVENHQQPPAKRSSRLRFAIGRKQDE